MVKEDKINVILDLDSTIINSVEFKDLYLLPSKVELEYHDFDIYYRIFARPELQEFLDFLFANFNVSVWTAAESNYAMFIVDNFITIKPERKLQVFFYRYHVNLAKEKYQKTDNMKDLSLIWDYYKIYNFYPSNTILIDDFIDVYNTNPKNVINLKGFDILNDKGTLNKNALTDKVLIGPYYETDEETSVKDKLIEYDRVFNISLIRQKQDPVYRSTPIFVNYENFIRNLF